MLHLKQKFVFSGASFNNVLNLNKKLFHLGIISQSKCSLRELYDETPQHIFYECTYEQNLQNQLRLYLSENVALPVLNPQSAIFDFTDVLDHNYRLVNHLLLIFKCNVYNSWVNNTLSFQSLKCVISQIKYKIIKIGSKLFFTLLLSLLLILLLLLLLFSYYYYCY